MVFLLLFLASSGYFSPIRNFQRIVKKKKNKIFEGFFAKMFSKKNLFSNGGTKCCTCKDTGTRPLIRTSRFKFKFKYFPILKFGLYTDPELPMYPVVKKFEWWWWVVCKHIFMFCFGPNQARGLWLLLGPSRSKILTKGVPTLTFNACPVWHFLKE